MFQLPFTSSQYPPIWEDICDIADRWGTTIAYQTWFGEPARNRDITLIESIVQQRFSTLPKPWHSDSIDEDDSFSFQKYTDVFAQHIEKLITESDRVDIYANSISALTAIKAMYENEAIANKVNRIVCFSPCFHPEKTIPHCFDTHFQKIDNIVQQIDNIVQQIGLLWRTIRPILKMKATVEDYSLEEKLLGIWRVKKVRMDEEEVAKQLQQFSPEELKTIIRNVTFPEVDVHMDERDKIIFPDDIQKNLENTPHIQLHVDDELCHWCTDNHGPNPTNVAKIIRRHMNIFP